MRKIFHHILDMPFVTAVSLAALLHSTWSLSTFFTGGEPQPQFSPVWFAWVFPGALIGVAIDIGILSIALELKHGNRGKAKLAAFFVLSTAMFYLQFLYLAAHTPLVPIAPGVSAGWAAVATTLRDLSVWVIPALLPLACLLYAFSDRKTDAQTSVTTSSQRETPPIAVTVPKSPQIASQSEKAPQLAAGKVMNLDAGTGRKATKKERASRSRPTQPLELDESPAATGDGQNAGV